MGTFFPRLDGLRAFAVVAVMLYHWHSPTVLGRALPLGFVGVQLFFVLSGFLIGGILLRSQQRNESEGTSQAFTLRQFVIRRAIRIFPAYFVFLLLTGVVMGVPDKEWWWYPLYLGNFRIVSTAEWPGYWAHTWTLAVEEQFYVFAPLVVLFLRRSVFARVLTGLIAVCGLFVLATPNVPSAGLIPPNAFYALLLGIGLALLVERGPIPANLRTACAFASTVLSLVAFVFEIRGDALLGVTAPIAFGSLVLWATGTGPLGRFLEWRPLMHLGGMAYGLYLWHMPIPTAWERLGVFESASGWPAFVVFSASTYVVARLSWTLVERPLNRYKRYFPYHRTPAEAAAPVKAHSAAR